MRPPSVDRRPLPPAGLAIAGWGVGGVVLLLGQGSFRLARLAGDALAPLGGGPLALALAAIAALGAIKGWGVFQRRLAPRVVARAFELAERRTLLEAVLAPLVCLGLLRAPRRRSIATWSMLAVMACAIVLARRLDQPFRGVVAGAVSLGLAWGVAALVVAALRRATAAGAADPPGPAVS